ncbi:class I SAM-dependent methyltransferase [Cohnella nanjingensis]|uniref:Class I SAM-dependent methyltransferase n=1 Tax=Cohnella nanjingensis TaxID=1387779 RepID=A0A7X0RV68_9BACL|nr:class I SAM-dependent methyltransferase [Cohnella nanjingensis]MBB6672694.1 class I SAM-dependent methyltransferase [Cohnella nanjingensis]
MTEWVWDERIDYLRRTRKLYYNDDYLQFLVERVWRIDRPVKLIDYGCGYGYLGLKLLGMLPEGSSYTGVDKGEKLIAEARELFAKLPYRTAFICADIRKLNAEPDYDIALCHAVLLHMDDPKEMLRAMIGSVKPGGMVICFEPHWISNMANQWMEGVETSDVVRLGILQKLFELDGRRTGRDGNIGEKVPAYMSELGLTGVGCRVSDRVNFVNPRERDDDLYQALRAEGFDRTLADKAVFVDSLVARGLTREEAERQYEAEARFVAAFGERGRESSQAYAPTMKISYGTVRRAGSADMA